VCLLPGSLLRGSSPLARRMAVAVLLAAATGMASAQAAPAASQGTAGPSQGSLTPSGGGKGEARTWGHSPAPTRAQVEQVVEQVRQDPDLGGTRTQRSLQFKNEKKPRPARPAPQPWLVQFVRWLADTSRLLVWVLGAVALALLLVGLRRWFHWQRTAGAVRQASLPSHVRDLDIRRESLPADIGAAARALWLQGEARAALSLLYRGALSRLVHAHAVPVRSASTEGECVRLAARALAPERSGFFARLVQAWQLTVYGSRLPDGAEVLALCAGFEAHLGELAPSPGPPATAGAAA
jgi:hypothetical protein